MTLKQTKPTSPGRRFVVKVEDAALHRGGPHTPLLAKKSSKGGRNNRGRITVRHRGGGHKQRYRIVDFRRRKDGVPARIERIEFDPNRSARLALLLYADGERRYILAAAGLEKGDTLMSGTSAPIRAATACRFAIFRSEVSSTAWSSRPARARSSLEAPERAHSSSPAPAASRPCACVRVNCAGFRSSAAPRLER